ncbi:MAG: phosphoadenosine phosphosulfate reductase family protein [Candidatus Riflebacteria bacterium]|nr:phosphoadenosine phosphosulfate reductase family protein [Candidatus Riflebacteria bacterium]
MPEYRHILSLSGGKDSTALALYMRDKVPEMEYVFCDTGKELPETYEYLSRVEAFLGKKITVLNDRAGFDHWLKVFDGYLPAPNMRWCTKLLKLKPFEYFVGDTPVISYIGLRADEDRTGLISGKPNLKTVFPFKEDGINYENVLRILEDSGIGLPPYWNWGRTNSGCYFCFFQKSYEWVRLLEVHPDLFDEAQKYEKFSDIPGKSFLWNQEMSLAELRKPNNVQAIKNRFFARQATMKKNRKNKRLIEIFTDYEFDENEPQACLICQL